VKENEGYALYVDSFKLFGFLRFMVVCVSTYFIIRLIALNKSQIELFIRTYSWFLFLISVLYNSVLYIW